MGYTHYWYRPKTLPKAKFEALVRDVKDVILPSIPPYFGERTAGNYYPRSIELVIRGPLGDGEPVVTNDEIAFNGRAPDMDHETFALPRVFQPPEYRKDGDERGYHFDFCKTARKPYDMAVCVVLIAAKHHFGDKIDIHSDGNIDGEEWLPAFELYAKLFLKRQRPPLHEPREAGA